MASKTRRGKPLLIAQAGLGLTVASCLFHSESPPAPDCRRDSYICTDDYPDGYLCDEDGGECVTGPDAGLDAASVDGGSDAGDDAGLPDSGSVDGGSDAG